MVPCVQVEGREGGVSSCKACVSSSLVWGRVVAVCEPHLYTPSAVPVPAPEGARRTAAPPAGHSPALEDCSSLDGEVCGSMTGIMYTFGLDSLVQELNPQTSITEILADLGV